MPSVVDTIAGVGGTAAGTGIGVWGFLRFVQWLCEFVAKRQDVRSAAIDAREKRLEERYDLRLRHLEEELAITRKALMRVVNEVARHNPANPILVEVADILNKSPIEVAYGRPPPPNPEIDGLLHEVDEAEARMRVARDGGA